MGFQRSQILNGHEIKNKAKNLNAQMEGNVFS